jgi:uncharacterized protein YcbK (DUF882 family)
LTHVFRGVLDQLEKLAGFEFLITSGARCEKHNATVTSNKNSAHITGEAVDIAVTNSSQRYLLNKAIYAKGIRRTGRNNKKNFTHVDIASGPLRHPTETMKEYPQNVDWDYDD